MRRRRVRYNLCPAVAHEAEGVDGTQDQTNLEASNFCRPYPVHSVTSSTKRSCYAHSVAIEESFSKFNARLIQGMSKIWLEQHPQWLTRLCRNIIVMLRMLNLSMAQRRSVVSSLFGVTFFATIATVSASGFLPCPAHDTRMRLADDGAQSSSQSPPDADGDARSRRAVIVVEKRPSRWIQERPPMST